MIYLKTNDGKYRHDLFELTREIIKNDNIEFIDKNISINKEDYLIEIIRQEGFVIASINEDTKVVEEYNIDFINIYEKNRLIKNAEKRLIYKILTKELGVEVPWGILTGIRPMKLAHNLYSLGLSNDAIINILEKEYLLSLEKINLMLKIMKNQEDAISKIDKDGINLYINIPFCPSKCSYCSFVSYPLDKQGNQDLIHKYIEKLEYEIVKMGNIINDRVINTVYIGGGTPTSLSTEELEKIIILIKNNFNLNKILEFTVEAGRPDTLDYNKLKMLKINGVNRISINPQTMNDTTLRRIGRNHNSEDIIASYSVAKELGFDIINMDMIIGLPGESIKDINNTLKEVVKLSPDNLTIHTLALKRRSKLKKINYEVENEQLDNKSTISLIDKYIGQVALEPYYLYRQKQSFLNLENIGYAKLSKASIYNILMMEETQTVIGIGIGAVNKIYDRQSGKIYRIPNFKSFDDYLSRVDETILIRESILKKLYERVL